ncbi:cutinase [Microdochium trichocladiopsis]|uniref:cutinase n=1 Tax=Microdochium trichocladiopsis TaxID=1682393 RepID=A0A9P8Y306_9PEZI|nr:cutinase [Microdochium trichocladiopsis]KAH7029534.1 cutinase [Microdochium trichocladiopsis]
MANHLTIEDAFSLEVRADYTSISELDNGGCRPYILFFARGTSQAGNVGDNPGPALIDLVKAGLGAANVAGQGVPYSASLLGNLASGGAPSSEAKAFADQITAGAAKCPNSAIFVSGYSQGAALVHRAVSQLSTAVKNQIKAAVTFGDTQKQQDGGKIPNFDASKTLIICRSGDLVCSGTLIITTAHSNYAPLAPQGADFIISKA